MKKIIAKTQRRKEKLVGTGQGQTGPTRQTGQLERLNRPVDLVGPVCPCPVPLPTPNFPSFYCSRLLFSVPSVFNF
jgi:hypothetical protein